MNQMVPISVFVPLRVKCIGLVVAVGLVLCLLIAGLFMAGCALVNWLREVVP